MVKLNLAGNSAVVSEEEIKTNEVILKLNNYLREISWINEGT